MRAASAFAVLVAVLIVLLLAKSALALAEKPNRDDSALAGDLKSLVHDERTSR